MSKTLNGEKMKAFHNDRKIKEHYLSRVRAHAAADEIVQGLYWQNGKGCAVGCSVNSSDHSAYEREMGIPQVLARLEDRIFEGLELSEAKKWPVEFLESISVGADLSLVWSHFAIWILTDPEHGVSRFNKSTAITDVAALYQLQIDGKNPTIEEWRKADAADDAAAYAAYAAAAYADAAAYAADDADDAAAYAADAADDAAAYAAYAYAAYAADAAYADARRKFWKAASVKLLELLRVAK